MSYLANGESRDIQCAADVGRMAALGRFDEEFPAYGCAYWEQGNITYRISSDAEQMYLFRHQSIHNNLYPTSIQSYIRRTPVPSGMREILSRNTKLELAKRIRQMYPHYFFESLHQFAQIPANNCGFPLLEQMRMEVSGHFDALELQLLEGTMQIVLEAKQLDSAHDVQLHHWLQKMRHQMEDDPVLESNISRTFYGFCYQIKNAAIKNMIDAQPATVWQRRAVCQAAGYIVGPIVSQTFWLENFDELPLARQTFQRKLLTLQNTAYFHFLYTLKSLKSVIPEKPFYQLLHQLQTDDFPQAAADFKEFGLRWNLNQLIQ